MESINQRIQQIIVQYYDGNVSRYCRDVDVKQTTMNEIIGKGQKQPSSSTLARLSAGKHVQVNVEWILTGKGEMIKDSAHDMIPSSDTLSDKLRIEMLEREIEQLKLLNTQLIERTAVLRYQLETSKQDEFIISTLP